MRPSTTPQAGQQNWLAALPPGLLLVALYLAAELLPVQLEIIDNAGTQWLYLAAVNMVAAIVFTVKKQYHSSILTGKLMLVWLLFLVLCTISGLWAFNRSVWLVSFSRIATTLLVVLNCATVFRDRAMQSSVLALLVVSGAIQALVVVCQFASGSPVEGITIGLGNRNILAAAIAIKFTIALFHAAGSNGARRWLAYAAATLMMAVVYLLSARAAIVGMFIGVAVFLFLSLAQRAKERIPAVLVVAGIFVVVTAAMQLWSASAGNAYKGQSVAGRLASISHDAKAGTFSRLTLWHLAGNYIKEHPFTGGGLGNWPINSIPGEIGLVADNYHSKHAHNDFLEIAADAGVLAALAYLAVFVLCAAMLVRMVGGGKEPVWLAAPFAGLLVYMCDASFNFPFERPGMQVLFALMLAMAITIEPAEHTTDKQPRNPWFGMAAITLSLLAVLVAWQAFRTMQGEYLVQDDITADAPARHSYADIEPYFNGIPDVTTGAIPISCVKARYLLGEQRYDEAFDEAAAHRNANPYLPYTHLVLGKVFAKRGRWDSALYYLNTAQRLAPTIYSHFAEMQQAHAAMHDSMALRHDFWSNNGWFEKNPAYWTDMASFTMRASGNIDSAVDYLEKGSYAIPGNKDILFALYYNRAYRYNMRYNYAAAVDEGVKALKIKETYAVIETLGISYFGLAKYSNALEYFDKATRKYGPQNGESLYYSGQCRMVLGDHPGACRDFAAAIKAGYRVEPAWLESCQ